MQNMMKSENSDLFWKKVTFATKIPVENQKVVQMATITVSLAISV